MPKPAAPEIAERWKAGASIRDLVAEFKITRSQCRKIITAAVGGKDAFRQLREQGAGGSVRAFGEKNGRSPIPRADDTNVKRLTSRGWTSRRLREARRVRLKEIPSINVGAYDGPVMVPTATIFISPKGREYVACSANEKADVIVVVPKDRRIPGVPHEMRMKRFADSRVAKRISQEEKDIEHGKAALKRIRQRKREARRARKEKKARV